MPAQISKRQIRTIKMAQRNLDIEDDDYRDLLKNMFRATSCTQLSAIQATVLIREFEKMGWIWKPNDKPASRPGRKRGKTKNSARKNPKVAGMVSNAQKTKIEILVKLLGKVNYWRYSDGYERWLKKQHGSDAVKTDKIAYEVIESLKRMFERHMAKTHGPSWKDQIYDDPLVMGYLLYHG